MLVFDMKNLPISEGSFREEEDPSPVPEFLSPKPTPPGAAFIPP